MFSKIGVYTLRRTVCARKRRAENGVLGGIIHAEAVQMPEPTVAIHFDVDQPQAVKTSERVIADAALQGYWIAAAHIVFPGFGHVRK